MSPSQGEGELLDYPDATESVPSPVESGRIQPDHLLENTFTSGGLITDLLRWKEQLN